MQLLGRSGTEMIGVLGGGSGKLQELLTLTEHYGANVSKTAAASADAWDGAMNELGLARQGMANAIGEPLREELLPVVEDVTKFVREHWDEIATAARTIANSVGGAVAAVWPIIKPLLEQTVEMLDKANSVGKAATGALN